MHPNMEIGLSGERLLERGYWREVIGVSLIIDLIYLYFSSL